MVFYKALRQISLIFLITIVTITNIFSQSEVAVPFLLIQPSPRSNGMAGAFTALPTDDSFGQYFNPAQLGNFGKDNNLSYSFYSAENRWLPAFNFSGLNFDSKALSLGYNFQNKFNIPVSIGMGYLHTLLDLGTNIWIDEEGNMLGEFESKEYYSAYSIGIGFDYYIRLNLGYTYKDITSDLGFQTVEVGGDAINGKAEADAYDIGLQITAPIISIVEKLTKNNFLIADTYIPFFDLHYGYTVMNVGDGIVYIDGKQVDPLPRTAQIGFAFSLGFDVIIQDELFSAVKFDYSSEARDILVDRNESGVFKYVTAPGNIDFWDNVICSKLTNDVYIHRGWRLGLFDFFEFSQGNYDGPGYGSGGVNTSGYSIRTKGLFKLFALSYKDRTVNFIANHFEISYAYSSYLRENSPLSGTEFNSITLTVFGF